MWYFDIFEQLLSLWPTMCLHHLFFLAVFFLNAPFLRTSLLPTSHGILWNQQQPLCMCRCILVYIQKTETKQKQTTLHLKSMAPLCHSTRDKDMLRLGLFLGPNADTGTDTKVVEIIVLFGIKLDSYCDKDGQGSVMTRDEFTRTQRQITDSNVKMGKGSVFITKMKMCWWVPKTGRQRSELESDLSIVEVGGQEKNWGPEAQEKQD